LRNKLLSAAEGEGSEERKRKRKREKESDSRWLAEARELFSIHPGTPPLPRWPAAPVVAPAKNIFFPVLVYRLSTPIICDADTDG
jgi:hypothetical protein